MVGRLKQEDGHCFKANLECNELQSSLSSSIRFCLKLRLEDVSLWKNTGMEATQKNHEHLGTDRVSKEESPKVKIQNQLEEASSWFSK